MKNERIKELLPFVEIAITLNELISSKQGYQISKNTVKRELEQGTIIEFLYSKTEKSLFSVLKDDFKKYYNTSLKNLSEDKRYYDKFTDMQGLFFLMELTLRIIEFGYDWKQNEGFNY